MNNSEAIEKLAANLGEEIYIEIAKWRLYLNDAHLHIPLATKILTETSQEITQYQINTILTDIKIKVGGGKQEISLIDLIPNPELIKLEAIIQEFLMHKK